MKKNTSIVLASLFTAVAFSGAASAANEQQLHKVTADECVGKYVDQVLTPSEPSLKIHTIYPDGYLERLVTDCENLTGSEAEFYKGMTKYRETRGNMTVEFK